MKWKKIFKKKDIYAVPMVFEDLFIEGIIKISSAFNVPEKSREKIIDYLIERDKDKKNVPNK
jgi:hypothetical protein